MGQHDAQVITVIAEVLHRDPRASINDLCRACVDAGLRKISKPYVARLRKQLGKAIRRDDAIDTGDGNVAVRITATPAEAIRRKPEELARERAEKARREAEREEAQRARQAEREAQWAAEREAQAQFEARRVLEQARADASAQAPLWAPGQPLPPIDALQAPEQAREGAPAPAGATIDAPAGLPDPAPPAPAGAPSSAEQSAQPDPSALSPRRRAEATRRAKCRQYLNELLDADPGLSAKAAQKALREKFGVGLDVTYIYETCRLAREIAGLPTIPMKRPYTKRSGLTREMHPGVPPWNEFDEQFDAPPEPQTDEEAPAQTPEEDLAWLAGQARDVMRAHNLSTLAMDVVEGEASWTFTEKPRTKSGKTRF